MKKTILIGFLLLTGCYIEAAPYTPDSVLPSGVDSSVSVNPYTGESGDARKGTIAATINNVARLNQLLSQAKTPENQKEIKEISAAIDLLIPSLQVIGMFDFFEPTYWIGDGEQPGRILVICLYFKRYPEKYSPALKKQLLSTKKSFSSSYLQKCIDAL